MGRVILWGRTPTDLIDGYGHGYGDGNGYGYGDGKANGDGNGYGYGDGKANGYGKGYGYGNGYGEGYGDGDGNGYGEGYGYGDGNGEGYGDGKANGYGYGDGKGYGYGYGSYWLASIEGFASKWPESQRERLAQLTTSDVKIAFWRSTSDGYSANGGWRIAKAAPGVIHTSSGPLELCSNGTLHATLLPPKWKGERCWIVAMHGEVIGDEEKFGCLKREIIGEAT